MGIGDCFYSNAKNTCSYCKSEVSASEYINVYIRFKRKRIPPKGAIDLGLFDFFEHIFQCYFKYPECPTCKYVIERNADLVNQNDFYKWLGNCLLLKLKENNYIGYDIYAILYNDGKGSNKFSEKELNVLKEKVAGYLKYI